MTGRVLVVDDEVRLARSLQRGLIKRGYEATVAHDGVTALSKASTGEFDLILLDLILPRLSGYRVVEALRSRGIETPVLMLTAKDGEYDEADAFDLGVDDYLRKPFSTVVLLARMSALLRRAGTSRTLEVGALRLEPGRHRSWVRDREIDLTAREYAVLRYLAERRDEPVSKQDLLDEVWHEPDRDPNVVEVYVGQLRRKLGATRIETVRGVGYRLVAGYED